MTYKLYDFVMIGSIIVFPLSRWREFLIDVRMKVSWYFIWGNGGSELLSGHLCGYYKYKLGVDMWQGHAKFYKDISCGGNISG